MHSRRHINADKHRHPIISLKYALFFFSMQIHSSNCQKNMNIVKKIGFFGHSGGLISSNLAFQGLNFFLGSYSHVECYFHEIWPNYAEHKYLCSSNCLKISIFGKKNRFYGQSGGQISTKWAVFGRKLYVMGPYTWFGG